MNMRDPIRPQPGYRRFNRRHFLRGLGVCMAVPAFESLRPFSSMAESSAATGLGRTATGAPLRTAFLYFPNGAIPSAWWPSGEGNDFSFGPTLKGLEPVRSHLQVLGGLDHQNATAGADGAGDHARGNSVFLTGVRLNKSATDIRAGVSIDQVIASQVGHLTRFPSLEMTCDSVRQTAACDSGYSCAYQFNISWSSPTTPMTPECNPRMVFERLFGPGGPGERSQAARLRQQQQRSVLDFVMDEARSMQRELTARDKEKLDQYLTSVRQVESRIQKSESFGPASDPGVETPAGIPNEYGEYLQTMMDLLVLAFQTDSTRVASLLLAHDGSNRSFGEIGISEGHHDLSHHQDKEDRIQKVAQIDAWYGRQFAKLLQKLQNTKDVDGKSLLYNSMIVYGGGNADGNRHTHSNLPIVLAGAGGGALTTGRFVKHGGKPMSNLFLTMADQMGCSNLDRFGDSTGRLVGV
jgi:hypothetical protein